MKRKLKKRAHLRVVPPPVEPFDTPEQRRERAKKAYALVGQLEQVIVQSGVNVSDGVTALVGALSAGAGQWNEAMGLPVNAPDGFVRAILPLLAYVEERHRQEMCVALLSASMVFPAECQISDLCPECGSRPIGAFMHRGTCSKRRKA